MRVDVSVEPKQVFRFVVSLEFTCFIFFVFVTLIGFLFGKNTNLTNFQEAAFGVFHYFKQIDKLFPR